VLVPAHNEAAGIAATIAAARAQLRSEDRLVVIADNCDDATAAIARAAGAEVIERFSHDQRGKGFALAAGRAALVAAPPAAVVVLDADCQPEPGALQKLAGCAVREGAAVQGRNLLVSNGDHHPSAQISLFAFAVKNLVRQRGLQRLGGPALLQGTGMAFAWPLFERAALASGCLAEDLELGLALVLADCPVRFLPSAGFHSPASPRGATVGQRTRWEHGSILTGWRHVPRLVAAGVAGRPALLLLALDLIIPPLALLAVILGAATLAVALPIALGASAAPLVAELGLDAIFALAVGYAWHRAGRDYLSPGALLRIPVYVLWKLPIYRRLLVDRQRAWVRTGRDA
jgi:cellulose synthase/poly-beta-1,6-N-acetylglucosamine synthase-like glycosyltransferase